VTSPPSLLELLLPGGRASSRLVIGSAAPAWLGLPSDTGPAELVVIAPSHDEARRAAWLGEAISQAAARATVNGMVYLMLPARTRGDALRRVRVAGYRSVMRYLHQPGFARTEHLVPVDRPGLRRWLQAGEGSSPAKRRVAAAAIALPGAARVAAAILPQVGMAAFREGASVPFGWLAALSAGRVTQAQVRAKWRGGRGGAVVTGLERAGSAVVVAKIALGGEGAQARAAAEAERLARLGPGARRAGALVPSASKAELPGGWPILLLSPLPGRSAAGLLATKARPPEVVIAGLAEWLARWNEATLRPGRLDAEWVSRRLVAPAASLGSDLPEAYLAWLRARAQGAMGEPLPSVATHGDLTMTNVLLADGSLGVVDWESAEDEGLPLHDLLYAAVDAAAAREGYRDRLAAFARCFPVRGSAPAPLGPGLDRLRRQAGLGEATLALCVHACWLAHAADERAKRAPDEARPFLAIVRHLAERAARGEPAL
jgi:hypothetical protein